MEPSLPRGRIPLDLTDIFTHVVPALALLAGLAVLLGMAGIWQPGAWLASSAKNPALQYPVSLAFNVGPAANGERNVLSLDAPPPRTRAGRKVLLVPSVAQLMRTPGSTTRVNPSHPAVVVRPNWMTLLLVLVSALGLTFGLGHLIAAVGALVLDRIFIARCLGYPHENILRLGPAKGNTARDIRSRLARNLFLSACATTLIASGQVVLGYKRLSWSDQRYAVALTAIGIGAFLASRVALHLGYGRQESDSDAWHRHEVTGSSTIAGLALGVVPPLAWVYHFWGPKGWLVAALAMAMGFFTSESGPSVRWSVFPGTRRPLTDAWIRLFDSMLFGFSLIARSIPYALFAPFQLRKPLPRPTVDHLRGKIKNLFSVDAENMASEAFWAPFVYVCDRSAHSDRRLDYYYRLYMFNRNLSAAMLLVVTAGAIIVGRDIHRPESAVALRWTISAFFAASLGFALRYYYLHEHLYTRYVYRALFAIEEPQGVEQGDRAPSHENAEYVISVRAGDQDATT